MSSYCDGGSGKCASITAPTCILDAPFCLCLAAFLLGCVTSKPLLWSQGNATCCKNIIRSSDQNPRQHCQLLRIDVPSMTTHNPTRLPCVTESLLQCAGPVGKISAQALQTCSWHTSLGLLVMHGTKLCFNSSASAAHMNWLPTSISAIVLQAPAIQAKGPKWLPDRTYPTTKASQAPLWGSKQHYRSKLPAEVQWAAWLLTQLRKPLGPRTVLS